MIASIEIKGKIDEAVILQQEISEKTAKLDAIKAQLTKEGLKELENKNVKYVQMHSDANSVFVLYKEKFELDNISILKEMFGAGIEDKITREESIKYSLDGKFKKALTALYLGEFENVSIDTVLAEIGLNSDEIKLAKKKLKGDYVKDYKLLKSIKPELIGDMEEELDAIRASKNYELISKFCDINKIDIKKLKRAVTVEESLAIGFN